MPSDVDAEANPRTRDIWWMFLKIPVQQPRALVTSDFWYLAGGALLVTIFTPLRWIGND